MTKSVLITGGSSGIGLEFTRQYLAAGTQVFTASRNPYISSELQAFKESYQNRLFIYTLDVGDPKSRQDLYEAMLKHTQSLDLLINNAGIISGDEESIPPFGSLDQDDLCKTFQVNAIAPLMMAECFDSLLKKGTNPIVVNITSENGSIARRGQRGKYGYCASKAALNMITKILSYELKEDGVKVVALHPGWVKTAMTKNEPAPLEPSESINAMIQVIEELTMEDSGSFLDRHGERIPW
ncbi:MAG: SDR family oxidoreductase [Anaerolineales bacterium]|jgi:NAD(P)-dependent dehydrogenase (short-subunit alcohol dehydrogenase family)